MFLFVLFIFVLFCLRIGQKAERFRKKRREFKGDDKRSDRPESLPETPKPSATLKALEASQLMASSSSNPHPSTTVFQDPILCRQQKLEQKIDGLVAAVSEIKSQGTPTSTEQSQVVLKPQQPAQQQSSLFYPQIVSPTCPSQIVPPCPSQLVTPAWQPAMLSMAYSLGALTSRNSM